MRDYLLFLDTEASGLPRKWNLPYSNSSNWPSAVQISWLIYKSDGSLVKTEDHYISDDDVELKASAIKINGLTREYLTQNGKSRKWVMESLASDLFKYQPLVIGHFMEFDYHVVAADYYRTGISNPLETLPTFCTMLGSAVYSRQPSETHLRLGELYALLFNHKLENPHNALADANATAMCFFELVRRGDITDEKIENQKMRSNQATVQSTTNLWFLGALLILLVIILIGMSI